MKRHTNFCLQLTEGTANMEIDVELHKGRKKFGSYNSMHEAYAVIQEELDEFWDGVKADDPDPVELLQVAATAKRAMVELCNQAREEMCHCADNQGGPCASCMEEKHGV